MGGVQGEVQMDRRFTGRQMLDVSVNVCVCDRLWMAAGHS